MGFLLLLPFNILRAVSLFGGMTVNVLLSSGNINGGSSTSGIDPFVLGKINGGTSANLPVLFVCGNISGGRVITVALSAGKIAGGNNPAPPTVAFSLGNINGGKLVAVFRLAVTGCA